MEPINITLGLSDLISGNIFILISLPLVKQKVGINTIYGIRIKKAFESEENWYKINRFGGKKIIQWSVVLLFISLLTLFVPFQNNTFIIVLFSLAPVWILIPPVISIFKFAKKL